VELPEGEKSLRICLVVSIQYKNVIASQTDSAPWPRPCLYIALRGKNERGSFCEHTICYVTVTSIE